MNKVFYIIGIVFSVVFIIVCGYYIERIETVRYMDFLLSIDSYSSEYGYRGATTSITNQAGLVSIFFFSFFLTTDILGIIRIKTATTKVLSIIGIAATGIFLLWDFMMLASPGALSFDEVGVGFIFYALIVLAFSIVGLIQSIRFYRPKQVIAINSNSDLLDS